MSGAHRAAAVESPPIARLTTAGTLLAVAIVLFAFLSFWQSVEAAGASYLYGVGTPTSFNFSRAVVFFGLGRQGGYGLRVTPECCSALLVAPAALLSALLTVRKTVPVSRILGAFAAVTAVLLFSNQLRIGVIAWCIDQFGLDQGYEWGHAVIGSFVSLIFATISLAILAWIALREPKNRTIKQP